jgi:cell division protein FtsB
MSRTDAPSAAASAQPYRRGLGRRLGTRLLLLATLILIVDALVGDKGLLERFREHQRFTEASNALDAVRRENATLREQSRRLREEDPGTIESVARRQLGMIKPGEVLFIVKDVDATPNANGGQTATGPAPAPPTASTKP